MCFVPERILRCRLVHTERLYYMPFVEQSLPAIQFAQQEILRMVDMNQKQETESLHLWGSTGQIKSMPTHSEMESGNLDLTPEAVEA